MFAPSRSTVATQPQLQPALLRLSAMISQYFTRGGFWLFWSPHSNDKVIRTERNDADANTHRCRDCVSLQYGSGNLAADCIRKANGLDRVRLTMPLFVNRSLCDHAALTIPACPRISRSCATLAAQLASRLRRWPLCRKLEGRSKRSNAGGEQIGHAPDCQQK